MNEYFFFIANIHPTISCVAVAICLIAYKAKQPYIRLLGLIQFLNILFHLLVILFVTVLKIKQNYLFSVANIIEFSLISAIYYYSVNKTNKGIFLTSGILFATFSIINLLYFQGNEINSFSLIFMSMLTILYTVYYFYWLIREMPTTQLQRLPMFWVSSGWMIFYAGNLFVFVFTDYLVNVMNNNMLLMWTVHNILKVIEVLMIVIALWIDLQNIRSRSSLA